MNTNLKDEGKKRIVICVHTYGEPVSIPQLSRLTGLTDLSYMEQLIRSLCAERVLRRLKSADTKEWLVCLFSQKDDSDPALEVDANYESEMADGSANSSILENFSEKTAEVPENLRVSDEAKVKVYGRSLTLFQRCDLVRRAALGEQEALHAAYEYYLPKVKAIARSKSQGDDADLFQVGLIGLLCGIETFNPGKSTNVDQHLSFAVSRAIFEYTSNSRNYFKASDRLKRASRNIFKSTQELSRSLNREPSASELALKTSLSEQKIREVKEYKIANTLISFGDKVESEEQASLEDSLPGKSESLPEVFLETFELPVELDLAFKRLREKEKFVLHHRYGLAGNPVKTFEQVGNLLGGLSRQRVKQIQSRALLKLRTDAVRQLALTLGIGEKSVLKTNKWSPSTPAEALSVANCSLYGNLRNSLYLLILTYIRDQRGSCNKEKLIFDVSSKIEAGKPLSPADEVTGCIVDQLSFEGYLRLAFNASELVLTEKGFEWLKKPLTDANTQSAQNKSVPSFPALTRTVPT